MKSLATKGAFLLLATSINDYLDTASAFQTSSRIIDRFDSTSASRMQSRMQHVPFQPSSRPLQSKPSHHVSSRGEAIICHYAPSSDDSNDQMLTTQQQDYNDGSLIAALTITTIAILYWVYLVFGAAAAQAGLPVPDFIPLVPGWPPSDADLAPALEDSEHFFYIQDLLNYFGEPGEVEGQPSPPTVRLAVFNFAEAWVFAFLPVLLADKKRLPLPAVLFTWVGALGLTNAFLAPYLAIREGSAVVFGNNGEEDETSIESQRKKGGRNEILAVGIGAIATTVVAYAIVTCLTNSSMEDWSNFATLAREDRTYLAFCVDLILFSIFQPFLLRKVYRQKIMEMNDDWNDDIDDDCDTVPQINNIPFVGLLAWLFGIGK